MINIEGYVYDGSSTRKHPATLLASGGGQIKVIYERGEMAAQLEDVRVSQRLGNIERQFRFDNGAVFVTADNDRVDQFLKQALGKHPGGLIHMLETKSRYVVLSLLILVLAMVWSVTIGIPRLAQHAAEIAPEALVEQISAQAMEVFDDHLLAPSELHPETQAWLQQEFAKLAADYPDYRFTLHFRDGGDIGANAFALPGGDLVVTDALVELAEVDKEVLAVLAHEMGHVVHRHGLRRLFEDSMMAALLFGVTGDINSFAQTAAALPTLLVSRSYARDFEREADEFAQQVMQRHGIDDIHFANILSRIDDEGFGRHGSDFLSTHPNTRERVQRFNGE